MPDSRKRARKDYDELLRRAQDYEMLFHASPALVSLVDIDGRFRVLNEAWTRTLGYPLSEFADRPFISFVHEDDRERTLLELSRLVETSSSSIAFRNRYRHRDGSWVHLSWYAQSDLVRGMIYAIALDVTEEERQRARVERYAEVLETTGRIARVGGWEIDAASERLLWSGEVFRIHELPLGDEPSPEAALRFYPEGEARETIRGLLRGGMERAQPWDIELPFVTAKGRQRWVRSRGEAAVEDGRVVRVFGSLQDITQRKQAERELARYGETLGRLHEITARREPLDEKLRTLLELGLEIFELELGMVSRVEGDDYEILHAAGRQAEDIAGTRLNLRETFCAEVLAAKGPVSFHRASENRYGDQPFHVKLGVESYIGTPLIVDGESYGTLSFAARHARAPFSARDNVLARLIAEWVGNEIGREHQRQRVEAARDEAERANRTKSLFLANMSHEIRTPMNGVLGMTELLERTRLDDEQRGFLETIRTSAEALLGVIDDILDVSKVEAGRLEIFPLSFRVRELVREALAIVRARAEEKGLRLEARVADSCPKCLVGDEGRVRQIVLNFVSNAIKFTDAGHVEVRVDYDKGACRIEVEDTGIGVDPRRADVLFDAFRQADASTTRRYGGSGLGLAICKLLAGLMEGEVGVRSRLGEGSVFWFRAPMAVCEACDPAQCRLECDEVESRRGPPELGPLGRVLVVEDHPVNQAVASRMLEALGAEVQVASGGREALEAIGRENFRIVFMDCQMPDMDGYETTLRLRAGEARGTRTPVVAMTAHVLEGEKERCLRAGMDAFLPKPVSMERLRTLLAELLRRPAF